MLVFIPTITMGIWADERKQGTDELLLTDSGRRFRHRAGQVPGRRGHLQRVAAVLAGLQLRRAAAGWASPDAGLFLGTYVGYWLVGLAMLAIGMVASFLTSNITIGFVLGVLFNVPLVFLRRGRRDLRPRRPAGRAGHQALEHRPAVQPTSAAAC